MQHVPGPPPGPGWWIAEDQRWYPPELYPGPGPYPGVTAHGWWRGADGRWYPWSSHPANPAAALPPAPAPGRPWAWVLVGLLAVVALVAAGAAIVVANGDEAADTADVTATDPDGTQVPQPTSTTVPADPAGQPEVVGDEGEPWNRAAVLAIADLEVYWGDTMPAVFGIEFEPIAGGYYAFSPDEELPPCATAASDIEQNAYYCEQPDVIAWDDTFLMPDIFEVSGDLGVALVLAHEWGHAVQGRAGVGGRTILLEQQADCYAGAWFAHLREGASSTFQVSDADLDRALATLLSLGDVPGVAASDPFAHGSAFDRINAFQDGLGLGASFCAAIDESNLSVTALPFTSATDLSTGGDLPFAEMLELAVQDLEAYWSVQFPARTGSPWRALGTLQPFQGNGPPGCGSPFGGANAFYCADGDFVAIATDGAVGELYRSFGDFAIGVLLGIEYARAVQVRSGVDAGLVENRRQADCLAGAWAASMFPGNIEQREQDGSSVLILSPGDLDEAAATLLAEADRDAGTAGFERVTAFRSGFVDGPTAC